MENMGVKSEGFVRYNEHWVNRTSTNCVYVTREFFVNLILGPRVDGKSREAALQPLVYLRMPVLTVKWGRKRCKDVIANCRKVSMLLTSSFSHLLFYNHVLFGLCCAHLDKAGRSNHHSFSDGGSAVWALSQQCPHQSNTLQGLPQTHLIGHDAPVVVWDLLPGHTVVHEFHSLGGGL